jgi:hypothetical protein
MGVWAGFKTDAGAAPRRGLAMAFLRMGILTERWGKRGWVGRGRDSGGKSGGNEPRNNRPGRRLVK